ncbi:anaerobic sulfite reductase subunit AsrA [Clostridium cellulovorans]|uniref:Sulfite reductase, subunit A n=1 Tax=Clostridium cellulovorans (strain ATCC 35296 / DSM 3052 / OCM 3 / 743B) TaxID=573061 RepID=D9STF0_CLOC7|nr:anaerobic sulfite reductase subunit AsrA [Clostridium cellulovorans]ADL50766.1 sulfite reductase, subunit A [Clostridium cellulovorans 743B]
MGFSMDNVKFNSILQELKKEYKIYAPILMEGKGTFSDTDSIKYGEISSIEEVVFDKKSNFSPKEVILPITQTLFYFTEDKVIEPEIDSKKILVFLRSCDIHSVKRLDQIYLKNGGVDPYYKALREKTKFVLMECENSFENCFCVSMGTNKTEDYAFFVRHKENQVSIKLQDEEFENFFKAEEVLEVEPSYVDSNDTVVKIPENLDQRVFKATMWKEYSARCIACGRCNMVCGTCACFTMQDIFYKDNPKSGERRRVWASCHVDGFTSMAGGHSFRLDKGERMRFKVMHKVYDYKKRFGYHMCTGCGRCDDVCPEYISFANSVNKLNDAMKEIKAEEEVK